MEVQFSKNRDQAMAAVERYERISTNAERRGYKRMNLLMDLTAADGVNGNDPIKWDKLMAFDDFSFLHDICGISRHMDRETGKLGDFFSPRST